jgi:predicted O-methyltransferase YrrM
MNALAMNTLPNIATAVTRREARLLESLAKDARVVEVGSLLGFSTVVMARQARRVWAIDPHEGYPQDDPRPTYPEFLRNILRYGVSEKINTITSTVQGARQWFPNPGFADLAFIDASGLFHDTLEAIIACDHWLKPGGILAVHDYGLDQWPGAGQAIDAWSKIKGREFDLVDTLAVFS